MADLPEAVIAHVSRGRVRLKIPAKKRDAGFFSHLEHFLSRLPGVEEVKVNPLTGSIVVVHSLNLTSREDLDSLAASSSMSGLFTLATPDIQQAPPRAEPLARILAARLATLNEHVKGLTGGMVDVPTLAIASLVAVSIRQLREGVVFIPAVTALWYAGSLLKDQLQEGRGVNSG
jgi:hypothetical protein